MNKHQKYAMWGGILVIFLMGVFPPWTITWGPAGGVQTPGGYASVFSSPDRLSQVILGPIGVKVNGASQQISASFGVRLDMERLFMQWIMVAVVAWGLYVSAREKS
ncbi:MAG: hypothetical protein HY751_07765 [Nitrospinae bacterium]|nr:hypothetical protein [Nitrospinota bacterium]